MDDAPKLVAEETISKKPLKTFFQTHKWEIISGGLGALVTFIISLLVGLYSLNESFELSVKKERLDSLQESLNTLRHIDRMLDRNLNLLLSRNSIPEIEFRDATFDEDDEEIRLSIIARDRGSRSVHYPGPPREIRYKLNTYRMPKEFFRLLSSSGQYITNLSEVDFEVRQELEALDEKFFYTNYLNERLRDLIFFRGLDTNYVRPLFKDLTRELVELIKKKISDISTDKIVEIKNKIKSEITRLEGEVSKIQL